MRTVVWSPTENIQLLSYCGESPVTNVHPFLSVHYQWMCGVFSDFAFKTAAVAAAAILVMCLVSQLTAICGQSAGGEGAVQRRNSRSLVSP